MRVLLRLLSTAAGNTAPQLTPDEAQLFNSYSREQWLSLIDTAENNRVSPMASLGLKMIAESNPDLDMVIMQPALKRERLSWNLSIMQCEQQCDKRNAAITALNRFYASHGISMMVLKGYSLDQYYPKRDMRTSGDIDIYLYGQAARADSLLESTQHTAIDRSGDKHSNFMFQGISVENHYQFLNTGRITTLGTVQKRLEELALQAEKDQETGCLRPSAQFNAIFLPMHFAMHFVFRGAMLFQILDWALFLNRHSNDIDWTEVTGLARQSGILRFLGIMNHIAVHKFGCSDQGLPDIQVKSKHIDWFYKELTRVLPDRKDETRADKIHKHIVWASRYRHTFNSSYLLYLYRTTKLHNNNRDVRQQRMDNRHKA